MECDTGKNATLDSNGCYFHQFMGKNNADEVYGALEEHEQRKQSFSRPGLFYNGYTLFVIILELINDNICRFVTGLMIIKLKS